MTIIRRGTTYCLKRRVPRRFRSIEPREFIWQSLGTDSRQIAQAKAPEVWEQLVAAWQAKLDGDTSDAEDRFEAARRLAQAKGFRYRPAESLSVREIVDRALSIRREPNGRLDMKEAEAVLGLAEKPEINVTRALDLYWTLTEDQVAGKNANQLRIWKNGRKKAVKNFVAVIGDLPLSEITADDMLDFREWWWQRIQEEGLTPNAANKDISTLSTILKTVNLKKRLGLRLPLGGLSIKEREKGTRPPFSEAWIRDKLAAPGALDGLNIEARCLLLGMVNTGYRPSEGAGLLPEHIHLDADVPHIEIRAVGRDLKSAYSQRIIPLTGVSLDAFRQCPSGFPRYRQGSGPTNAINKFLRAHGLCETEAHTLYSLRHSFEDRLLDRDVDERIRRDLLGHRLNRERYGKGASLEKLAQIVGSVAI